MLSAFIHLPTAHTLHNWQIFSHILHLFSTNYVLFTFECCRFFWSCAPCQSHEARWARFSRVASRDRNEIQSIRTNRRETNNARKPFAGRMVKPNACVMCISSHFIQQFIWHAFVSESVRDAVSVLFFFIVVHTEVRSIYEFSIAYQFGAMNVINPMFNHDQTIFGFSFIHFHFRNLCVWCAKRLELARTFRLWTSTTANLQWVIDL